MLFLKRFWLVKKNAEPVEKQLLHKVQEGHNRLAVAKVKEVMKIKHFFFLNHVKKDVAGYLNGLYGTALNRFRGQRLSKSSDCEINEAFLKFTADKSFKMPFVDTIV